MRCRGAWTRLGPSTAAPRQIEYLDGVVRTVAALPGVEAVGLSDVLPLGRNRTWGVRAKGVDYPPGQGPSVFPRIVDQHYLQAMQIPLRAGRFFDDRDTATSEKTVIINEHLARELWPDRDAIGQQITQNGGSTVIGVVADVRHGSLEKAGGNEMYLHYRQSGDWQGMEMVVRSARSPASLVGDVRSALATYDPSLPTGEFYPLEQLIDNAVGARRLTTQLLGFFSALALTLAAIGLYGVIAQSVVQRTQEIGIRMAIGAQRQDVLGMILGSGLRLVSIGVATWARRRLRADTRVANAAVRNHRARSDFVRRERRAAHLRRNRGLPVPRAAGYEGQSHHRPARGIADLDHRRRCLTPAAMIAAG